jgi:hypothetical protein
MATTVNYRFQIAGKSAATLTADNPIPLAREMVRETDTGKIKFGDGATAWNSLGYHSFWTTWARVESTPTTLAGYGITDAQPLGADLTALEALSGTNTIYYRSAANTWTPVTIGGHLSFSGGTLNVVTAGSGAAIPRMDTSTVWSNTFTVLGNFTVGNGTTNYRGIFKGNGPYAVGLTQGASNGYVFLGTTASATPDFLLSDGSGVELLRVAVSGALQPTTATTASAANLYQSASGAAVLRSTSSKRYKKDIEALEPARADALLGARPIWYRSTADADNPEWGYYGLLAEELAAIDPRLVNWAYRDSDYRLVQVKRGRAAKHDKAGELIEPATPPVRERRLRKGAKLVPDGVQYERLTVLLLDIVRRQGQRIAELERRLPT